MCRSGDIYGMKESIGDDDDGDGGFFNGNVMIDQNE